MYRIKTISDKSNIILQNPNDTLDFVMSIAKELNFMLQENKEKIIGKVEMRYGASKATSEQQSEKYEGVKAYVTLKKKAIAAGTQGYFVGNRDRWKYTTFKEDGEKIHSKNFDNHLKINFQCKSLTERETLKSLVIILLTFKQTKLKCSICDLDYIEDVEIIKDELFEFNVYVYARTTLSFKYEDYQEPLKEVDYNTEDKKANGKDEAEIEEFPSWF